MWWESKKDKNFFWSGSKAKKKLGVFFFRSAKVGCMYSIFLIVSILNQGLLIVVESS